MIDDKQIDIFKKEVAESVEALRVAKYNFEQLINAEMGVEIDHFLEAQHGDEPKVMNETNIDKITEKKKKSHKGLFSKIFKRK